MNIEAINKQREAVKEYLFDKGYEMYLRREDLLSLETYSDPKFVFLLSDLQANIIKPHGKQCAVFAFITFQNTLAKRKNLKKWLSELPLTNAMDQIATGKKSNTVHKDAMPPKPEAADLMAAYGNLLAANKNRSEYRKRNLEKGRLESKDAIDNPGNEVEDQIILEELKKSGAVICFYISHAGYKYFGEEGHAFSRYDDTSAFVKGLAEGTGFGTEESNIEPEVELDENNNYQYDKVHAMLMVAFDAEDAGGNSLANKTIEVKEKIEKSISGFGNAFFETGYLNKDRTKDASREWFGFKDGLSNPRFFPSTGITGNSLNWEEPSKLDLVLRPDRGGPDSCGSFLVFMKLRQDTDAFVLACKKLAVKLSKSEDYAGALLIGRHKDGTLLTKSEDKRNDDRRTFNYERDDLGLKCPFHAHIRKANPRDGNSYRRIVRRGMLYDDSESNKGLLFMSFQGDLKLQFEDLVNEWLFNPYYRGRDVGADPILSKDAKYNRQYSKVWGKGGNLVPFSNDKPFVTFKGGLYFFAPSISYIKTTLGKYW
ncbi:MAG: Dyp-type peroxidase [Saprospiraceae bacterium]